MKIAIHHKNVGFSKGWLEYCKAEGIQTKIVNCYSNDIISELNDCDALMWHFHHADYRNVLFAKQLMYSLQISGKVVFPDFNTVWFFDDKVGQKYLLEAVDVPLVPAYVFYKKNDAMDWAGNTSYPKVFKLRRGASSENVQLIRSKTEAYRIIKKAFGRGFPQYDAISNLQERWRKFRNKQTNLWDVVKGILRIGYTTEFNKMTGRERGYVYFQDFVPDKKFDLRVIVIDGKAFGIKRMNRKNDFRASGSGFVNYNPKHFDEDILSRSFFLADKLDSKLLSIDYLYGEQPVIIEINFGYNRRVYEKCEGYWDRNLNWHEGPINPEQWMVDAVVRQVEERKIRSENLHH